VNLDLIIVFLYAYLIGSMPFGLIITKLFLKKDVRNIGSGNIGATNVLRTGNKSLAILTLFFDILKGYISIHISFIYFHDLIYLAALACLVGHIFPVWLNFNGGKGVATYLGIILALSYKFAIIFGVSWLTLSFLFKYSSLSSIFSTLLIFLYSLMLNNHFLSFYFFIVFIIILYTHRENIIRLKNKTETKIKF
jgi:glycerol-3-phosphate acyltransferase PlsY|tara:strand:- start:483 stop:1064 length:582 start_codon:yes stop_codon:yes gene_type:complete